MIENRDEISIYIKIVQSLEFDRRSSLHHVSSLDQGNRNLHILVSRFQEMDLITVIRKRERISRYLRL